MWRRDKNGPISDRLELNKRRGLGNGMEGKEMFDEDHMTRDKDSISM